MNKEEAAALARQYFIADTWTSMAFLIRQIQLAEGSTECYAMGKHACKQMNCRWRETCQQPEDVRCRMFRQGR